MERQARLEMQERFLNAIGAAPDRREVHMRNLASLSDEKMAEMCTQAESDLEEIKKALGTMLTPEAKEGMGLP